MLDWAVEVNPDLHFTFECTAFSKKHPCDWDFVCHSLGVTPVVMDAKAIAPCRRKRAFWSSFPWLELEWREAKPLHFLDPRRRPAPEWQWKMPTIMAAGPRSWNMKLCVEEEQRDEYGRSGWIPGPLRVAEVERMMGFTEGSTAVKIDDVLISELDRWKCLGNAIHASVMAHVMVSVMVTRGYVTRDNGKLKGQPWTLLGDHPRAWLHFWVVVLVPHMATPMVTKGYATRDNGRQKGQPWTLLGDGPDDRFRAALAKLKYGKKKTLVQTLRVEARHGVATHKPVQRHSPGQRVQAVAGSKKAFGSIAVRDAWCCCQE